MRTESEAVSKSDATAIVFCALLAFAALALVFALWAPMRPGSGRRAALYLGGYCALRLGVEVFRGDAIRGVWAGVSTSQLAALVGLIAALLLARGRRLAA